MKIGFDTTFLVQLSVQEHEMHLPARREMDKRLQSGDVFALAPQVISEFVHIITDPRRFAEPLSMPDALEQAKLWWNASEVERVSPTEESMIQFWQWMNQFSLGRKRILDTMLAATYYSHQVEVLLSSNARDYSLFGCFEIVVPEK